MNALKQAILNKGKEFIQVILGNNPYTVLKNQDI